MKIAFASGRGTCRDLAGDTVQMLKTKQFLEAMFGLTIDILEDAKSLDTSYDILHLFNLPYSDGVKHYINHAKRLGIKIVLSTIFWDFTYSKGVEILSKFGVSPSNVNVRLLHFLNLLYQSSPYAKSNFLNAEVMKECIAISDILLPNSKAELKKLAEYLKVEDGSLIKKSIIVPNAVDASLFQKTEDNRQYFKDKYRIRDFVLTIGRISPNKNQLSVVEALYDEPEVPIVFVGVPDDVNGKYFRKLKKLSDYRKNVYFLGEIEHEELPSAYNSAYLHVLPSFRDSPGLVSLEAALCGCEIVVSEELFGPSDEYFGKYGHFCEPNNTRSIKAAIMTAYTNKKNTEEFRDYIKQNYTWSNVARVTYEAYKSL